MAHLSLSLLGLFQAELDGQQVTGFESNKVRALLAYLATEADRPHARQALAGLLWPDYTDRSALNNLRSALANLRHAIGDQQTKPPFLIIDRDTIQFNPNSDHWLDLECLQDLPDLTVEKLEQAISACRGSFLEGFSLNDSPPFEEWLLYKREQTNRKILGALQRLAAHYENLGDYGRTITYTRQLLELEPWDEDAHRQLMRVLACSGQRSAALMQYKTCRRLLKDELGVEPGRATTTLYEHIRDESYTPASARLMGRMSDHQEEAPSPGDPPYKGLHYFEEGDADLFFGREALTVRLVTRVNECLSNTSEQARFLAIIGASGSGKSSILRAGLIPALRHHQRSGTPAFGSPFDGNLHLITPTTRPLEALAITLTRKEEPLEATIQLVDELARDPRSLHLAACRSAQNHNSSHLLLVVDQFEELFSLCHDETQRQAFIDNLLYAATAPGPTIVIVSLRADFYAYCAPYQNLRMALSQNQEFIGAMNTAELRQAIEEPARFGGWELEPGLVDLLLREVGNEPGALPLLSHALLETWQRRRGRCLTLSGYAGSGGVHGAISRTAETTFNQLTSEQQSIARNIFLRLTELGEGTQDTRRRASLTELISDPQNVSLVLAVLKRLADARLITVSRESVEVAHEALIREWGTLLEWLNENREALRLHRQLTQAAQEWDELEREPEALYRGARLSQVLEMVKAHFAELNPLEQAFLDASQTEQMAQQAVETARQQRELEAAKALTEAQRQRAAAEKRRAEEQTRAASRLRRRAVYLALALSASIMLLLAALWLGQLANRNAQTAQAQTRLASSRELAAAAVSNLQIDPERSVLLALQSLSTADTLEARNAIRRALTELHILRTIPAHQQSPGVAYSPDGTRLASIGIEGVAKIWDVASGKLLLELPSDKAEVGWGIAYSPDGTRVVTVWNSQLVVWDVESGQREFTIPGDLSGGTVNRASFSPDNKRVAVAHLDGIPRVWDLDSGTQVFALSGNKKICDAIAFSPDGSQLATGDQGGTVKIWDAASGQELLSIGSGGVIHNLAYSPDGARLAAANEDGTLTIWDPTAGREALSLPRMSGLYSVAFMPDGKRVVSAHQDGTTKIWDAVSGQLLLTLAGHVSTVVDVASSPDGKQIATAGFDGTIRQWDPSPGREVLTLAAHTDQAYGVRYSLDGSHLATVGMDGYARIWEARTGRLVLELAPGSPLSSLAYSPDSKLLAAGGEDGMVYAWELDTGKLIFRVAGHQGKVPGVAFSPDGTWLVSGSWDATIKVWEVSTAREIASFAGHTLGFGFDIAFSPDGETVYSGGADSFGRQWKAATGHQEAEYFADGREIYGLAVSPDGRLLALGLHDGEINAWDTIQKIKILTLTGHAGLNARLAFTQDGSRLASANFDGLAKVWDVHSGQELFSLYGNTSNVFGVAFSPDGSRLATAGGDGTLRIFTMDMNELVALARSRLTRSLTLSECQKYLHLEQCPVEP
jgi:WD40 repeat protein/DNA-binding SARP family transcriptional activator/energy-coupling factor transporter ATP-binding protein EcfA2